MTGTAIGKQKFKVEIPFDDGSDENCLVSNKSQSGHHIILSFFLFFQ